MPTGNPVADQIVLALTSPLPTATLLTGPWGCGKTYFWNNEIFRRVVGHRRAIYCSLFGASSVDDAKKRILSAEMAHLVSDGQGSPMIEASDDRWVKGLSLVGRALLAKAESVSGIQLFGSAIDPLSLIADDAILCIDDLERASMPDLRSALGLVNYLVEIKRFRVLLIVNPDGWERDSVEERTFRVFAEKVAARHFRMETLPASILSSHPRRPDFEPVVWENLKEAVIRSGSPNLRTLNRCIDVVSYICQASGGREPNPQHINQVVAFVSEQDAGLLKPSEYYSKSPYHALMGKRADDALEWKAFLDRYFGTPQLSYKFAPSLYRLVTTGAVDPADLACELWPAEQLPSPVDTIVAEFSVSYFLGDEARASLLADALALAADAKSSFNANQLAQVISFSLEAAEILQREVPLDWRAAAMDRLVACARAGDDSFDTDMWRRLDKIDPSLGQFVVAYSAGLRAFEEEKAVDEVASGIRSGDEAAFYRMAEAHFSYAETIFNSPSLRDLVIEAYEISPDYHYALLITLLRDLHARHGGDERLLDEWRTLISPIKLRSNSDRHRMQVLERIGDEYSRSGRRPKHVR